ncbi:MAG: hypothetical protein HQ478_07325 [Chloroflexi bacterium]|nr:hypothetical protein [Chloroflexota bacterium]
MIFLLAIACEEFYTPAASPTPGPTPTQVPPGALPTDEFELARNIVDSATEALENRLGRVPSDVRLDSIEGRPFTRISPGCLPPPELYEGIYNIPGVVAGLIHEGIRYEYHADAIGGNGALCDSVPQLLSFTELAGLGQILDPERFVGETVVAIDAFEANALELDSEGTFIVDDGDIDWENEDLVGTTFAQTGCNLAVTVDTVEWLIDPDVVRVNVFENATGSCEQEQFKSVFLLVEGAPESAEYEFRSVERITVDLGGSMMEVTPTPDIQIEAIQTALAGGK